MHLVQFDSRLRRAAKSLLSHSVPLVGSRRTAVATVSASTSKGFHVLDGQLASGCHVLFWRQARYQCRLVRTRRGARPDDLELLNSGAISVDETRTRIGLGTVEHGDALRASSNCWSLEEWIKATPRSGESVAAADTVARTLKLLREEPADE